MPRVVAKSSVEVAVPSGQSILVFCQDKATVYQKNGESRDLLGTVTSGSQTFGPFASGATIVVDSGEYLAWYSVGVSPVMREMIGYRIQRSPIAINSSGSIPLSTIISGVINANAGLLGLTGTLPTGAVIDAASDFRVDDAFDWYVISTGLGTYTIAASAGHTIVGAAGVGSTQSGHFRTRKSAANTFVTMRIG